MKYASLCGVGIAAALLALGGCKHTPVATQSASIVNAVQKKVMEAGPDFARQQTILSENKAALEAEAGKCKASGTPLSVTTCVAAAAVAWDLLGQSTETDPAAAQEGMSTAVSLSKDICGAGGNATEVATNCDKISRFSAALGSRLSARGIASGVRAETPSLSELTVQYQALGEQIANDWPALAAPGPASGIGQDLRHATTCSASWSYDKILPAASQQGSFDVLDAAQDAIAAGAGSLGWPVCSGSDASCDANVCTDDPDSTACKQALANSAALICQASPS